MSSHFFQDDVVRSNNWTYNQILNVNSSFTHSKWPTWNTNTLRFGIFIISLYFPRYPVGQASLYNSKLTFSSLPRLFGHCFWNTFALAVVLHAALFKGKQMARYLSNVTPVMINELQTPQTYHKTKCVKLHPAGKTLSSGWSASIFNGCLSETF